MATINIRFRTQDTRAAVARKLNQLLTPLIPAVATEPRRFEETPATLEQWARELERAVRDLTTAGVVFPGKLQFRLSDTRQMWARKLNIMSAAAQAGPTFTITLVANPTTMAANGTNTSTITATVKRADGTNVSGATVTWSKTGTGTLAAGATSTTNGSGVTTKVLTAPAAPGSGTVTVSTVGGTQNVTVTYT